jgi:SAM-dependent methyltransferase
MTDTTTQVHAVHDVAPQTTGHRCGFCAAPLTRTFIDLGETPLANAYIRPEDLKRPESRYPLHARVCDSCFLVQVDAVVPPEEIFTEYAYFSSYSDSWVAHARRFATAAKARFALGADDLVIEIASNDGYLLRHFAAAGVPVLGVDPAANVAAAAEQAGVPTRVEFFGKALAERLVAEGRRADLLVANNVLAHVPDLNDFVAGMATVLAPDGVLSVEFPHLLRLIDECQFDTIYHEHFYYLSLATTQRIFAAHGLRVFDVEQLASHGGSLRIFACRADSGAHAQTANVDAVLREELAGGLEQPQTYDAFAGRVQPVRQGLRDFLIGAKARGLRVVGHGAAAKGNTLLNYCGIGPDLLPYVVDNIPYKQGRYLPGSRIPVLPTEQIDKDRPDFILILPWNLRKEIASRNAHVHAWGARYVVAVPRIEILEPMDLQAAG